jgi:hypothetical protein
MNFKDLCYINKKNDEQSNSYTRYLIEYNKKMKEPLLVSFTSGPIGQTQIKIHKTDLASRVDLKNVDDISYIMPLLNAYFAYGCDFIVDDMPISKLSASRFGSDAVITDVSTEDEYCRKGLASYSVELIQDYYKKKSITGKMNKNMQVFAARNNFNDEVVYANPLERRLGSFGSLLAHANSKLAGNRRDRVYNAFLYKNNFRVSNLSYEMPRKSIISDRMIISSELLDEENKPAMLQCGDEIISLDKTASKDM